MNANETTCLSELRFFEWHRDTVSPCLRNKSGSYGGGIGSPCCYQNTVGSLCATDYKWVQQQQVEQDKLVVIRVNE